jgi:hypothetical protein
MCGTGSVQMIETNAKTPFDADLNDTRRWVMAGLLVMAVFASAAIGCGRGEYDKRLGQRIDELRVRATAEPADEAKADDEDASSTQSSEADTAPTDEVSDATDETPAEDAAAEESTEAPETDAATDDESANPFQEGNDNANPDDSSE